MNTLKIELLTEIIDNSRTRIYKKYPLQAYKIIYGEKQPEPEPEPESELEPEKEVEIIPHGFRICEKCNILNLFRRSDYDYTTESFRCFECNYKFY